MLLLLIIISSFSTRPTFEKIRNYSFRIDDPLDKKDKENLKRLIEIGQHMTTTAKGLSAKSKEVFMQYKDQENKTALTTFFLEQGILSQELIKERATLLKQLSLKLKKISKDDLKKLINEPFFNLASIRGIQLTWLECFSMWTANLAICAMADPSSQTACYIMADAIYVACVFALPSEP